MNSSANIITSTANPKFRFLLGLERPKNRKESGLTAVEGLREISVAFDSGIEIVRLYCTEDGAETDLARKIVESNAGIEQILISKDLFTKVAYRETGGGMIAVVKPKKWKLRHLNLPENPLILILAGVEKPGNIGAMLRTADAAGLDAVFCCDMPGDLYNPNTIRASLGTIFALPVIEIDNHTLLTWINSQRIRIFCSHLYHSERYDSQDYKQATAIIMGSEANGVTEFWERNSSLRIGIPMLGKIDSMNVSVAAAIIISEAKRQRGWK